MSKLIHKRPRVLIVTMGSERKSSYVARLAWLKDHPSARFEIIDALGWTFAPSKDFHTRQLEAIQQRSNEADLLILHRVLFEQPFLDAFFKNNRLPVIFDYDDALYAVPSSAYRAETRSPQGVLRRMGRLLVRGSPHRCDRFGSLVEMLKRVDAVSAGNPHLAKFAARHCNNVQVVPTVVDVRRFPVKTRSDAKPVTIGWYGSPDNQWYLDSIKRALIAVSMKCGTGVRFEVISSDPCTRPWLDITWTRWEPERELSQILRFDLGIMPLSDDEWARGKSGNKAIYYMGLGIPAVVSPVGVNAEIVEHGRSGYHARTTKDWSEALSRLVEQPELRYQFGQEARRRVELHYSRETAAEKLSNLIDSAFVNGRNKVGSL